MKGSLSICFTCALAPLCSCSVITKRHTRSGGPCSYSLSAAATSLPTQQLTICTSLLFLVLSSTHFWPETFLICLSSSSYSSTCHLLVCASSLPLGLVFCPVIYFFFVYSSCIPVIPVFCVFLMESFSILLPWRKILFSTQRLEHFLLQNVQDAMSAWTE